MNRMQQTLFPFGLEPCKARLVLSIVIAPSFEGWEREEIGALWLNILLCQSRYIMPIFWVNRAVCCDAVSIVEWKESCSVSNRVHEFHFYPIKRPVFQNRVTVHNKHATIQLWFWLGQLSQCTTKPFAPSCMSVKNVSRQEAISLNPYLPRVSSQR